MSTTAKGVVSSPAAAGGQLVTGGGRLGLLYYLERKTNLPPEVEEGNVEYKLKLLPGSDQRRNQLTSQLQWRLTEHGECYYMLGYITGAVAPPCLLALAVIEWMTMGPLWASAMAT